MNNVYTITCQDPQGQPIQYGRYSTFTEAATIAQTLQAVADDWGHLTHFSVARQTPEGMETMFQAWSLRD